MGVTNAMISADMALAGITSIVPFEEVCQAMRKVGKTLPPSLRETGMGGVAGTKTGQDIRRRFWDLVASVMTTKIKTKNYPQDFQNLVDFLIELFIFIYTFCNQNRQHE